MEIKTSAKNNLVPGGGKVRSRLIVPLLAAVVLSGLNVTLPADPIDIPFDFTSGQVISSSQMNANFGTVRDELNIHDGVIATLLSPTGAVWGLNGSDIFYNDGNVGIGTNTPASLLSLYSATSVGIEIGSGDVSVDPYIIFDVANDDAVMLWRDNNGLKFNTGGSPRMIIEAGGDVGIGTSNPIQLLELYAGNLYLHGGELILDEQASGYAFHMYSEGEKLYITQYRSAGGEVHLINTYNNEMDLYVERNVYAADFISPSDARLKEGIAPITGALDRLIAVDGVSFRFKGADEPHLGLVAQNVLQSVPEAVSVYDAESGYLGVDYQALIPVLIEAIKELKAQNDHLLERVTALEAR